MDKNIIITIKPEDIKADRTSSGQLIDKLAKAIGEWESNELWENNIDYQDEGALYLVSQYDYEAALIEILNKQKNGLSVLIDAIADETPEQKVKIVAACIDKKLKQGAALALNAPDLFTALLSDFTDAIKESKYSYMEDDSFIAKYAPELAKDMQKAVDEFQEDQYKEWLYGDHRDFAGILRLAAKFFDAESVDYDRKADEITLEFTPEAASEMLNEYEEGTKATAKNVKSELCDLIANKMEARADEEKAKREKRAAESKVTREYQAKRKADDEAERIAKLKSMTK